MKKIVTLFLAVVLGCSAVVMFSGSKYTAKANTYDAGDEYFLEFISPDLGEKEISFSHTPLYDADLEVNGREYVLISDKQAFTYTITGEEEGFLYAVWTTGENPFIKKYVDIRVTNGFVSYAGGEASENFDNAYSAISLSTDGRVHFFDDPTDEIKYEMWDVAYRYELEGEVIHNTSESYEDEYGYYPAEYWVDDPEYSYPDGEINVTGTDAPSEDFE
jgi:hypothetical protein